MDQAIRFDPKKYEPHSATATTQPDKTTNRQRPARQSRHRAAKATPNSTWAVERHHYRPTSRTDALPVHRTGRVARTPPWHQRQPTRINGRYWYGNAAHRNRFRRSPTINGVSADANMSKTS